MDIKIRAWDIDNKEMIYIDDLYWFEEQGVHDFNDSRFIFMRYIGKQDKHGKDIYEKDICTACWYSYVEPEFDTTGEVVFNKGLSSFCIWSESDKTMSEINGQGYYTWEIDLLGNPYENIELLEEV